MALCPYGRASVCFPLTVSARAALSALAAAEGLPITEAEVAGYTTEKTRAAGAASVRLHLLGDGAAGSVSWQQGAHLTALRATSGGGWLLGLAGTRRPQEGLPPGLELVVMARPDQKFGSLMYLPEETLRALMPEGSRVELRAVRPLLPVQHDCPEQWLRDRLLKLADIVEVAFSASPAGGPSPPQEKVSQALQQAGLLLMQDATGLQQLPTLPADTGNRVSPAELGYWEEEMRLNARCAASMEGQARLDHYMSHLPG